MSRIIRQLQRETEREAAGRVGGLMLETMQSQGSGGGFHVLHAEIRDPDLYCQ